MNGTNGTSGAPLSHGPKVCSDAPENHVNRTGGREALPSMLDAIHVSRTAHPSVTALKRLYEVPLHRKARAHNGAPFTPQGDPYRVGGNDGAIAALGSH